LSYRLLKLQDLQLGFARSSQTRLVDPYFVGHTHGRRRNVLVMPSSNLRSILFLVPFGTLRYVQVPQTTQEALVDQSVQIYRRETL
jgi:hypothetical protein